MNADDFTPKEAKRLVLQLRRIRWLPDEKIIIGWPMPNGSLRVYYNNVPGNQEVTVHSNGDVEWLEVRHEKSAA